MSDTTELFEGTVLWFRPEKSQGAVKADNGRHFRFDAVEGIEDVCKGLRVRVRVDSSTTPPDVVAVPLASGKREFGSVEPPKPKAKATPATKARRKAPSTSTANKAKVSPGGGRRASSKIAASKARLPNGAFQVGTTVHHVTHGQGHIILSTPSVARVKFMPSGEERQVKVSDLSSLEGRK